MYKVKAHESGDDLVLHYQQDVEPILNIAARERRIDREATFFQKSSEFKRTMIVPFNVLLKIRTEKGLDYLNPEHSKAIAKLLKSSEYAGFRTTNKKRR